MAAISNGNITDGNGNVVNLVNLLQSGTAETVPENSNADMAPNSGWYYDADGNAYNIIDLIVALVRVTGVKINGGALIEPDGSGVINITISGDGTTAIDSALSDSSTNPLQNKVITQECTLTAAQVNALKALLD